MNDADKLKSRISTVKSSLKEYRSGIDFPRVAMASLDLTSLNDDDTDAKIKTMAEEAIAGDIKPASLCVYGDKLSCLEGYDVTMTSVVLFPSGKAQFPTQIAEEIAMLKNHAVDEIDIVADYEHFQAVKWGAEEAIINAVSTAKTEAEGRPVKVILETATFHGDKGKSEGVYCTKADLYDFATLALEGGADFLKTSTGKHKCGGADLDSVVVLALAIKDHHEQTGRLAGLKIAGGVNKNNYKTYMSAVAKILGEDFVKNPKTFRIGASGLYNDLRVELSPANAGRLPCQQGPVAGHSY